MTTQIGIGLELHRDGAACGRQAARAALAALRGGQVSLALLFTSHPQPDRVLKGVNEALGNVLLVGATSAGEYTHQGYVEGGAAVMLIGSQDIRFHLLAHRHRQMGGGKLLGRLHGLSDHGLGSPYRHRTLMLFPDDRSMNLDGVVDRAMTETALLYDILGGPGPTISEPPRRPAVFYNRRLIRSGLVGAEVLAQEPLGLALANGWTPISGPYRVTRTDERRVVEIDGRPAREVYEDFLNAQREGIGLAADVLLRYPIGVCTEGDCKVSVVTGCDAAGTLQTASPPPVGSLIHILGTRPDAMLTAVRRALGQAFETLGQKEAAGLLFIDCLSTAMVLGEVAQQQREVVRQMLGDVPFLGFRSHGVLARLAGQTAGHYECSVAACVLPG